MSWTFKKYVYNCSIEDESVEKYVSKGNIKIVFRDYVRYFDNQEAWENWLDDNMSDEEYTFQNFRALALLIERLFGVTVPMLARARKRSEEE